MSFLRLALTHDLDAYAQETHLRIAAGMRNAAERMAARAKLRLRMDVTQSGLGQRNANAWRADIYPKSRSMRTHSPAVLVYTKAPNIMQAFGADTTITSSNGVYLAIPTANTPRRGRRPATPPEVEAIFNQDLIIRPGKRALLAFVKATQAKNGKAWRRPTKRRTADGREAKLVLMFVLVKQVSLRKRLNWPTILKELEEEWPRIIAAELAVALSQGSN